ncbi:uncharacterized protein BO80DRAFT_292504 [Aspergillus ibericus CBS 121593]|uniref:Uncharacterized protein n=1 Tax=Aspergillus ibericus CBS 121593 TaxID=1448316 RepID=A0A395GHJ9_9EURO|nr:hypothetical protein BO80DRAFT_292504 [Aspergillus ibericus CBS 121593]RAK94879.1 hypothetical protein BO80DRAFT_292504 [Aspergillus ibericus CBS 121593]
MSSLLSKSTSRSKSRAESTPATGASSVGSTPSTSRHSVMTSSQLAMTGLYPPQTYKNLNELAKTVAATKEKLKSQDISPYLSFKHVSAQDFKFLDENRAKLCNTVRLSYFGDISVLIIKLVTPEHETAHNQLAQVLAPIILRDMGVDEDEWLAQGAKRYTGQNASEKEADRSWRNVNLRPARGSWPHFVIEAGVSESMPRLRQDAAWWISHSGGHVLLVLLIKVSTTTKTIIFEKYFPKPRAQPGTRARTTWGPIWEPELISTTEVRHGAKPTVQGAPIVLEFDRVIGRPPVQPEQDILYTDRMLLRLARQVLDN